MTTVQRPNPPVPGLLSSLRGQTMAMAVGTGLSRLTGLLRILVLAYALGFTRLADAYNLANNVPNMLHDIVLGGVLSATFIPVFVERLVTRSETEAWRAISAVVTLSVIVLFGAAVVSWLLAPQIIDAFMVLSHTETLREQAVATSLLRWFVPQVALYGCIGLATALLNSRRRFIAPMWTAIGNNVVCILVLLWFRYVTGGRPSLGNVELHPGQLVLLGVGTTMGLVVQALLLLPSLRRAGLLLRWHFEPRHEAVRAVGRLGKWTLGFVLASQIVQFVVLALAVGARGTAPVSSYMYAYTFLQMPFAIVAVSIMSAVTPDLAERWATGEVQLFRRRLATGLRAVVSMIVPAAVGMLLLAHPGAELLLAHGAASSPAQAGAVDTTGTTLAMFALGLPGFCAFQYEVRVLQAMQRTQVAFWLYLIENGVNVALAVALVHPLGVPGLALSLSVGYTIGALVGLVILRDWLGPLGDRRLWAPLRSMALATVAMGVVVLVVVNLSGATHGVMLLARVAGAILAGGVTYLAVVSAVGGWVARRAQAPRLPKW